MHILLVDVQFDGDKAKSNFRKHGITFDEAATCLVDENALVREDELIIGESRWILVGASCAGRLLTVVYTLRGENPRLISARKATAKEAKSYA